MARILLLGYFGAGNFGDEALLADWLIRHGRFFRDQNFDIDVVVRGDKLLPGIPSSRQLLDSVSQLVPQKQALRLDPRDYQVLVLPGGSILQDSSSVKSLLYYLWFIRRFTQSTCRVLLLNQGIGPISSWLGSTLTPIVLRNTDMLSLRDEQSMQWAQKHRVDSGNCRLVQSCDPILLYDQPPLSGFDGSQLPARYFAYIPRRSGDLPAPDDLVSEAQAAATLIRHVREQTGMDCLVLPYAPEDLGFAQEIVAECVGDAQLAPGVDQPQPDYWQLTRHAQLVITSRLHGLIAAAGALVPCLGIAIDPKISQIGTELGFPWCFPATQHREDTFSTFADLWNEREHVRTHLEDKLKELRELLHRSDEQFRQLI
ncbi:MAG: polysaccharide pyruvyl transferase family protein [Planctomycetales bacterium]|nr:polysaccharide pyruvyl transferase family protein [bacterium]UNM08270.1 MAG: polysaccharide pyruvyl transferase family protein [Planctomycetales bacterium]